jgi:hypothetical protein
MLKKTRIKTFKLAGGMAQVEEGLPSKCEALSLNPSTIKKQKLLKIFLNFNAFLVQIQMSYRISATSA